MLRLSVTVTIAIICMGLFPEIGLAQDGVGTIPDVPDQLPWWAQVLVNILGRFPDINGWIVLGFVAVSTILTAASAILSLIAERTTETDVDDKLLVIVNRLSLWTAAILRWLNAGSITKRN